MIDLEREKKVVLGQIGALFAEVYRAERVLSHLIASADAALIYLSMTHAPQVGFASMEEAFKERPPRLVPYPLPEFSGGSKDVLFYFNADDIFHTLGPMSRVNNLVYGAFITQIYDIWEDHLRKSLAKAAGEKSINSELFGELRQIRKHVAHWSDATFLYENKILQWAQSGILRIGVGEARQLRNLMIAELDQITSRIFGERLASQVVETPGFVFPFELKP